MDLSSPMNDINVKQVLEGALNVDYLSVNLGP